MRLLAHHPEGREEKSVPYTGTRLDQVRYSDVDTLQVSGGPSNMNCMRRTLRRMLALAVEKDYAPSAPRIHLVRERRRKAIYLPKLEKQMLETATQPLKDIATICFDTGMRPDEVVRLEWAHILWDRRLIYVDHGKTAHSTREVPLSDRVRDALLARLKAAPSGRWVFPSKRKKGFPIRSDSGPVKQFRKLRALLGIPKELVLYSARHTFGTELMRKSKGNIKLVQEIMGHESMHTAALYLHPEKDGVADLINERNEERAKRAATVTEEERAAAEGFGRTPDFGRTFGRTSAVPMTSQ